MTERGHFTRIVRCPFDKGRVICSCGYQSERFDSMADAEEDESRHLSLDAPEDYDETVI